MGTITLSVPEELKEEMSKTDWINWSSVARHAFSETLKDIKELQLKKKILEISEIAEDDTREVKDAVVKEIIKSVEETRKAGLKPMTAEEFNSWCELS